MVSIQSVLFLFVVVAGFPSSLSWIFWYWSSNEDTVCLCGKCWLPTSVIRTCTFWIHHHHSSLMFILLCFTTFTFYATVGSSSSSKKDSPPGYSLPDEFHVILHEGFAVTVGSRNRRDMTEGIKVSCESTPWRLYCMLCSNHPHKVRDAPWSEFWELLSFSSGSCLTLIYSTSSECPLLWGCLLIENSVCCLQFEFCGICWITCTWMH